MVKNIAYATEEETLMGNGVNLRTLTNDGGSAVISDYGAHLLRWAPAGQPDVIWTPRKMCIRDRGQHEQRGPVHAVGAAVQQARVLAQQPGT